MKLKIIVVSILILLVLLTPFPAKMKDGGTLHYDAILFDVYDVHRIKPTDNLNSDGSFENEYIEGVIVEIFGIQVFNNTEPYIEK